MLAMALLLAWQCNDPPKADDIICANKLPGPTNSRPIELVLHER
jgi:hypothetical protein